MSNTDLKKLKRIQLLEMLLMQTQRVEELEAELKEKDLKLAELQKQLDEKKIAVSEAGTLAQAALEMNNIFRRADKAASQYLENVKIFTEDVERLALKRSLAAKQEAEDIIKQAKEERQRILQQAGGKADEEN